VIVNAIQAKARELSATAAKIEAALNRPAAQELPALVSADTLVELDKLEAKLSKIGTRLAKLLPPPPESSGDNQSRPRIAR
jgi:hypothetical protein